MQIQTVVAPLLGTNCVILTDDGGRCVVVDPGGGVEADVIEAVQRDGLEVVALLATHGHVDHTWAAADLGAEFGVPLLIHADDEYRLDDPFGTLGPLGPQLAALAEQGALPGLPGAPPRRPAVESIRTAPRGTTELRLGPDGSFAITAIHTPGHTEGSTVYVVGPPGRRTALTGDVLFAGTIGRTDLPGGDAVAMTATLATIATWDPEIAVIPGHGPATTIGDELVGNPYLSR